jgi:hypothetical protein
MASDTQKLRILRSRTDQELLILVQHELDRGYAALEAVLSRNSTAYAQAEKAHASATTLLSKIGGLSDSNRLSVEARLGGLRQRLAQVPAYANLRAYPASFAS